VGRLLFFSLFFCCGIYPPRRETRAGQWLVPAFAADSLQKQQNVTGTGDVAGRAAWRFKPWRHISGNRVVER
jgi:hypothetical protein